MTTMGRKAQTLADMRAKFVAREKSVVLVTDGGLLAEHEQAAAELEELNRHAVQSLAGDPQVRVQAEKVRDLEQRLADATVTVRVRGLGRNAFRRLLAEHAAEGEPFDRDTFPPALIAACSLDPVMTADEVEQFADLVNDGQFDKVFEAAWDACREVDGVPFSPLASIVTRD